MKKWANKKVELVKKSWDILSLKVRGSPLPYFPLPLFYAALSRKAVSVSGSQIAVYDLHVVSYWAYKY